MTQDYKKIDNELEVIIQEEIEKLKRNIHSASEYSPIKLRTNMEEYYPYIKENVEKLNTLYQAREILTDDYYRNEGESKW